MCCTSCVETDRPAARAPQTKVSCRPSCALGPPVTCPTALRPSPIHSTLRQLHKHTIYRAVGKAVANHAEVRGSILSTDVGKEPDREIFAPVSDASV